VRSAGHELNSLIYTAMMQCYAKMADPEEVVRVLEEVKARDWPATSHMINHLITAHINKYLKVIAIYLFIGLFPPVMILKVLCKLLGSTGNRAVYQCHMF